MRSPLGKKIALLLKKASFLNHNPEVSLNEFCDHIESRREFLKQTAFLQAGLLLGSGVLTSCVTAPSPSKPVNGIEMNSDSSSSKVIILGAGMAGLTSAYYLTKAQIPCEIYESSFRSGGRIFTKENFNQEHMYCELGGELLDSNNQDLFNLCRDFSIEIEAFAEGDKGLESNLYFIKNKLYTDRDLLPAFKKIAWQLEKAKALPPEKLDQISLEEYLSKLKGVEPWLIEVLRIAYVGESGVEADQQSALTMISTIYSDFGQGTRFFGDSDESLKMKGGNSRLTNAIEKYLLSNGVQIHFGVPLIAIKELTQKIEMQFSKDTSQITVKADRVICTIPFSKLREVDGVFRLSLDPLKKICIKDMNYGTNSKLMLGFDRALWRKAPKPHSNGMVYSDLFDQNLWETSRLQTGSKAILTSYTGGKNGAKLSAELIPEYLNSFELIFPGLKRIFDSNTALLNWSKYPHSKGSYSAFAPGQITQFGDIAGKTELANRLLFAGEHATKEFAGFINGAAYSGRIAAEKIKTQKQL